MKTMLVVSVMSRTRTWWRSGLLCVVFGLGAARAAEPAGEAQGYRERDGAYVRRLHPGLDLGMLERFYEVYSPDLLEEWRRRGAQGADEESGQYLLRLAEHFLRLEDVRRSDLAEYERLLEYERLQRQIRQSSRDVQRLLALGNEPLSPEAEAARLASLEQAQRSLRELLERAFDESLRQQTHEIERLQAEVDGLRRLVEERRMNRQQTLSRQYRRLTGQAMPE